MILMINGSDVYYALRGLFLLY